MASLYRYLDLSQLDARPHRWRLNLRTGKTREEPLSDRVMEFGMVCHLGLPRPLSRGQHGKRHQGKKDRPLT